MTSASIEALFKRIGGKPRVSSGMCSHCDTVVRDQLSVDAPKGLITELRHLVDDGMLTPSELADLEIWAQQNPI